MPPHSTYRPLPAEAGMCAQIAHLTAEAERQLSQGLWDPAEEDAALARKTASGLAEAVGEAGTQERLPVIDRLEHLREALAVLAIALARIHGPLAWYLAQAGTALSPVLRWRALPADRQSSFGTVVPSPSDLADAERAVRRLHTALSRAAAATGTAAGTAADGCAARSDT
ncbi:hypothetical protein OG196_40955 [Kitasatospora purpeofusca]|uniref:hypothetical protein n=1 Tax=Kitasatospora purpeofusca TaxID=67352 RepID=UPI002E102473|nr:hypothetical protein OG196_40955 [Kitasatospora purpeofusca]